jgi:hypothetical protein
VMRRLRRAGPGGAFELLARRTFLRARDQNPDSGRRGRRLAADARCLEAEFLREPLGVGPLWPWESLLAASGESRLRASADAAREGKIEVLGVLADLNRCSPWTTDPVSGHQWPMAWGPSLARTAARDGVDVKVVWDLSRAQFFPTLAAAARYWPGDGYRTALEQHWRSWLEENPPYVGINWVVPMEAAIRAINWTVALAWTEAELDSQLRAQALASLLLHGRFVRRHLEHVSYVLGNHYFANLTGLAVLGALFRHRREGLAWLAFARRELEREIIHQFYPDGGNFEASLPYHRFVLEMAVVAGTALCVAGEPWSTAANERISAAREFLVAVQRPDGTTAPVGDDDDGAVLRAVRLTPRAIGPTAAAARHLLESRRSAGGTIAGLALGVGERLDAPRRYVAATSGTGRIAGTPLGILVSATRNGQDGNGGHAHNDKLSFELWCEDAVVVGDPGVATYTADRTSRNRYRGTASHATLMVDGIEQNAIVTSQLFRLSDMAQAALTDWDLVGAEPWIEGRHHAYERLADPVRCRRRWRLVGQGRAVVVEDRIDCAGAHDYLWSFPLPSARADIDATCGCVIFDTGVERLRLEIELPVAVQLALEPLPWAPAYGQERDGQVLRIRARGQSLTARFVFAMSEAD